MGIRKIVGSDPAKLVDAIYKQGRAYHDGKRYVGFVGETQKEIPLPEKWEPDAKSNSPLPQTRADQRASNYDNDTKAGWLNGRGKPHPHFDYDPAGEPTRRK